MTIVHEFPQLAIENARLLQQRNAAMRTVLYLRPIADAARSYIDAVEVWRAS